MQKKKKITVVISLEVVVRSKITKLVVLSSIWILPVGTRQFATVCLLTNWKIISTTRNNMSQTQLCLVCLQFSLVTTLRIRALQRCENWPREKKFLVSFCFFTYHPPCCFFNCRSNLAKTPAIQKWIDGRIKECESWSKVPFYLKIPLWDCIHS